MIDRRGALSTSIAPCSVAVFRRPAELDDDVSKRSSPPRCCSHRSEAHGSARSARGPPDVLEAREDDLVADARVSTIRDERTRARGADVDSEVAVRPEHHDRAWLECDRRAALDPHVTRDDVRARRGGERRVGLRWTRSASSHRPPSR